ncbi:MAG: ecdysteroid 22-kinase family protein [Ilumatobacteraceae bacterium]|nr:ecdysteroid 22-kinase family protein [Ilumatobacteraceae bacterium]
MDYTRDSLTDSWWSRVFSADVVSGEPQRIGDGLVGMNLRVPLNSVAPHVPASVVVKMMSEDATSRATAITLGNYMKEVRFYSEIAPTIDVNTASCHFSDFDEATHDFVLVLDDLAPARQGNQITGCDVETAQVAVTEMTKLHGPRWGDPTLFDVSWLQRSTDPSGPETLNAVYGAVKGGFLDVFGESLRVTCGEAGVELVHELGAALVGYLTGRDTPQTLVHGDFRLDNLMFGGIEGGHRCAVVDWQTPAHGDGVTDLSYFLGAGLLPDARRLNEETLVMQYVDDLGRYVGDVNFNDIWRRYRREALAGVVMSVVASQIVQRTERGDAMFDSMATRHVRHALDMDSLSLL